MKLAIVNTKGGVTKTTTAVYLAVGFSAHGRTLFVDCDPQESAASWVEGIDRPFEFSKLPYTNIDKRLPAVAAGYDYVVIDTPPGNVPIIKSAVLAAEVVLVPTAPTPVEVNRLVPTLELLAELGKAHPFSVAVLLTRMRYSTNSAKGIRKVLDEHNWPVMETEIPLSESYAKTWGEVPTDLGHYGQLVKELLA